VSPGVEGCHVPVDRRQRIPGYRDANHPRPIPKAATPVATSMSAALCGPESNPVACPNQRSPRAINNGPAATRTIFIRAPLIVRFRQRVEKAGLLKRNPPLATGPSLGRKRRYPNSIHGSVVCRNSHTLGKTERWRGSGPWTSLAKGPSASHIDGMESGPSEIKVLRWLAGVGAIVTASSVGYIAHYDLGFSRQEIRTQAVIGAVIIGLLVTIEYLGKKLRKPK
jgi:hypothetical protein